MNLKLKEVKSIVEYLSEFQDLVNQMVTMKLVIDDELQALLLLSSLPDSWETYHLVILLRMVCYNLPWLKIVCLMKN